jgi:hypothetical protein
MYCAIHQRLKASGYEIKPAKAGSKPLAIRSD